VGKQRRFNVTKPYRDIEVNEAPSCIWPRCNNVLVEIDELEAGLCSEHIIMRDLEELEERKHPDDHSGGFRVNKR